MKKTFTVLIFTCFMLFVNAENITGIDSLETSISKASGLEKIALLIQLSESYRNIMYDDCIINGQKAVILAQKINRPDLEGKAYKSMGVSCYMLSNYKTALDFFQKAYDSFKKSGNILEQGNCLNNIGLLYDEWSNYPKAESYYTQALELKTKAGDKSSMATTLINLGNINYYKFNYQGSLDYYYRAKILFEEVNDKEGIGQCLNNIAIIYKAWGNVTQAMKYLQEAEKFYTRTGNEYELSKVYTNMADTYCEQYKDYKQGIDLYEKSLLLKKKLGDLQGMAMVYNNMGSLYGNMENYKKATSLFKESRQLYTKLNSVSGLVMVDQNEGKIALLQKNYQMAKKFFERSLSNSIKINLPEYISSNQEYLLKIAAATCNYTDFSNYYTQFIAGKDSIVNQLNRARMAEIEAKYKAEEQLNETLTLKERNEESLKAIHHYRLLLAGFIGIIVLILVILAFYLWFKQSK
ncbi:MAG: hypothetical protein DRJ09_09385 [Bacteroidetes bacterium]|nr:MAG: hypothetical protein DRJ09_09385 [Bacteroidota bacterium]